MGLEQVIDDIRSASARRSQEILGEASHEADSILADAQDEVSAYQQQRKAAAEADMTTLQAQSKSHAEFEARKATLVMEVGLRDDLEQAVLDAFAALPATRRNQHLDALLGQAAAVIPDGSVQCAPADEKHVKAQKQYKFAGTTDIVGGIIVESKDGTVRLDLSYETLLRDMWRDVLRKEKALFA